MPGPESALDQTPRSGREPMLFPWAWVRFLSISWQLCYTRSIMRSSMPASAAPCKARGRLSALLEDPLVSASASLPVTNLLLFLEQDGEPGGHAACSGGPALTQRSVI